MLVRVTKQSVVEDCIAIREMVEELAIYERYPDGPKIDYKQLEMDGFGDHKYFHTFVAQLTNNKQLIGYVLYFYKYSTWDGKCIWMEDIYVKPEYRGCGVGLSLWQSVCKLAVEQSCARLEFNVLDWNHSSIQFYARNGAINLTQTQGWLTFRLPKQQIVDLAQKQIIIKDNIL